jgi:hypothetical protein
MHAPALWTRAQAPKSQLRRTVENNWRRMIPRALRKQIFFVRLNEHCGKVANSASLAGRNKLWPAVRPHRRHIVTLLLPRPRSTTFRRTERCAYRRNHQSQHCQEGKHGCVCRPDTNWNRCFHSFIFTRRQCSRAVNPHLIAMRRQFEKQRTPSIGGILMFDARQKASVVSLLVILKIHPARPRQPQRMQPRAIDRRPNPIQKGP